MGSSNDAISIVFSSETGGFIANVEGMDAALAKTQQSVADAKNALIAFGQDATNAAQKSGASQQQLAAIQQRVAKQVAGVTEENANRIINSLERQRQKALQVSEAMVAVQTAIKVQGSSDLFASFISGGGGLEQGAEAIAEVGEAADHSATRVQKASASIRLFEGDLTRNIRAAEAFVSQFEALQGIMSAGFQIAGVVAIGYALYEMGEKAYHAYQNVVGLKGAIEGLNQVQITVDKKVASLEDATESHVEDILTKNSGRTAGLNQKFAYQSHKGIDLSDYFYNDAFKKLPDDVKGNYENLYKNVAPTDIPARLSKITAEVNKLTDALSFNKQALFGEAVTKVGDFGANDSRDPTAYIQARLTAAKQIQAQLQAASDNRAAALDALSADRDESQKTEQDKAARLSSEAMRKANAERLKAMEEYINQWKLLTPVSQKAIFDYWEVQKSVFSSGSAEYNAIVAKQATLAEEGARKTTEAIQKYKDSQKDSGDAWKLDKQFNIYGNNAESSRSLSRSQSAYQLESDNNAASIEKTRVEIALSTGAISQLEAQQRLAAISSKLHTGRLADLNKQLEDLKQNSSYNPATGTWGSDKDAKQALELQGQIDKETTSTQTDAMQSQAKIAAATWSGALKNANAEWVQSSQNSAQQVTAIYKTALNGLNSTLADLLTGQKANWSSFFTGLAKELENFALQKAEGSLLSKVGGNSTSAAEGGFLDKVGSWFSGLFGGGRAIGGDVTPGHFYRVNESGQEYFAPAVAGVMKSAGSAVSSMNGAATYVINVANGVTPEQMNTHVRSALSAYHTTVMPHGAVSAVQNAKARNQMK